MHCDEQISCLEDQIHIPQGCCKGTKSIRVVAPGSITWMYIVSGKTLTFETNHLVGMCLSFIYFFSARYIPKAACMYFMPKDFD